MRSMFFRFNLVTRTMKFPCVFLLVAIISVCQANIRIIGSDTSLAPLRVVFYEKCGSLISTAVTESTSPNADIIVCQEIAALPSWVVSSCSGPSGGTCSFTVCLVKEESTVWTFKVKVPTPTACDVDGDKTKFTPGLYSPETCCP